MCGLVHEVGSCLLVHQNRNVTPFYLRTEADPVSETLCCVEELCLLGCYAVWIL
jgi:hypothetical protein